MKREVDGVQLTLFGRVETLEGFEIMMTYN